MNVTVENLAACKKLVRIEVEALEVDKTFESVTKEFQHEAVLPGFRPGKAPVPMVLRKYAKDIEDEVRRKLMSEAYKKTVEEKKLEVLGNPDVEEIQFSRGQPFQFAATVETAPEFEMPDYKGISVQRETRSVSEQDLERALDTLRQPRAEYKTVERPVQAGDIAVVNYAGTCEGKPIGELAPEAKSLAERKTFWVEVPSTSFIPGFSEQLLGSKAGDKRQVTVDFPADFSTKQLAGKKANYEVEVVEVKERTLPAMDDAFAKSYGAESLEKLREGVRQDLEKELVFSQNKHIRNQLVRTLLDKVNFELPESAVERETRHVVYDIVQENAKRGVTRQAIEQNKDQIYSAAAQGAKERVRAAFLMHKIAAKEGIKVSQEDLSQRVMSLAAMYQIPVEQFVKDLDKRNGMPEVFEQLLNEKVLDLLQKEAKVTEVPAGTLSQQAQPPRAAAPAA